MPSPLERQQNNHMDYISTLFVCARSADSPLTETAVAAVPSRARVTQFLHRAGGGGVPGNREKGFLPQDDAGEEGGHKQRR